MGDTQQAVSGQIPARQTASDGVGATPIAASQENASAPPWIGFWNLYSHRGSEGEAANV